jgi:hypothetical protein
MEEGEHDVPYFRNLVDSERTRLQQLCDKWESTRSKNIPEEGMSVSKVSTQNSPRFTSKTNIWADLHKYTCMILSRLALNYKDKAMAN